MKIKWNLSSEEYDLELRIIEKLKQLYGDIRDCRICSAMAQEKEAKLVDVLDISSDVFIVSQAPARNQLRRSGISFFHANGKLGSTGRRLEEFLNKFGRTVYPAKNTLTLHYASVSGARSGFVTVYNTEIVHCYPGKKGKGDRRPTEVEVKTCLGRGFLKKEISLLKPKLIILMGVSTRNAFYKYVLGEPLPTKLSEQLRDIVKRKEIPKYIVANQEVCILPMFHASGVNPMFNSVAEDDELIGLMRSTFL